MFNFLGRDFFNALAEKDADRFYGMIVKWLCALCVGIPVFVFRDYYQVQHGGRSVAQLSALHECPVSMDNKIRMQNLRSSIALTATERSCHNTICILARRASWLWSGESG